MNYKNYKEMIEDLELNEITFSAKKSIKSNILKSMEEEIERLENVLIIGDLNTYYAEAIENQIAYFKEQMDLINNYNNYV